MNTKYELIIGVIASRNNIYDNLVNIYWKYIIEYTNKKNLKLKIYLLYSNEFDSKIININKDNIHITNIKDSFIPGCLLKTISFMKYIKKKYNYKYFYRTNLSSFLIIDNLLKILKTFPNNNVYAGLPVLGNHGFPNYIKNFISGAGFFLSNDLVDNIINNEKKLINIKKPDDVIIGKNFEKINKIYLKRFDIIPTKSWNSGAEKYCCDNFLNKDDIINILNSCVKKKHFHIRVKIDHNRNIDLNIMKIFTEKLYLL